MKQFLKSPFMKEKSRPSAATCISQPHGHNTDPGERVRGLSVKGQNGKGRQKMRPEEQPRNEGRLIHTLDSPFRHFHYAYLH